MAIAAVACMIQCVSKMGEKGVVNVTTIGHWTGDFLDVRTAQGGAAV